MSWFEDSNIKKSYIVQTVSDVGIFSACTQIYLTNILPCAGDTINITGNLGVSGNISGTTYYGDGSQLSGIVTTDNYVTGGVYSASTETLYFTGTTGFTPFSVDVSALLDDTNSYVTGGTYNPTTDIVTLTRNDNVSINITGVSNTFTTGATYDEGTELITFVRNDGNSYTADLSAIASATTNSYTTGATLNGNIIEFANSVLGLNYYSVDLTPIVSGATNSYTTGATLNGNIIEFANNLFGLDYYNVDLTSLVSGKLDTTTFNTYTADTQTTLNSKLDTTSFNTYSGNVETQLSNKTDNSNFTSHTGDTTIHFTKGSINLSDLGSSAHTHSISEVINLQTELDGKLETTLFNTYTGDTETALNSKLDITTFNTYSGSVQTELDSKVESASNIGGANEVFSGKSGTDLQFRTISGGSNTTITTVGGIIKIDSTGGGSTTPTLQEVLSSGNTTSGNDIIMTEGDDVVFKYSGWNNRINTQPLTTHRGINFPDNDGTVALVSDTTGYTETTLFNTYTGDTETALNSKLDTTSFNVYSGSVETQLNSKTDNTDFTSHTGDTTIHYTKGSINLSDLGSSAHTHSISEVVNLQTELDSKTNASLFNTHTGDTNNPHQTSFSNLTSTAHTHSISDVINLQTELDNKLESTTFNSYTGSVVDVFVSSGNANVATQQLSFTNTTGGTFNVTNAAALFSDNDINVTGGTYNPTTGCVTFTTNSGTTFDVCGFVTGITDTFVTGYAYSDNTFTLSRNQGLADLTSTINTMTGLTVNGVLSATTYTGITLDGIDDVTTNIPASPDNTYQGELLYFDAVNNQWVSNADYGNLGDVTIWGKKGSAGTIDKGCPVYITGFDNDIHEVELANATTATTMPVIGFTAEDFDNAGVYPIITFGKISGLDTTSTVSTLNPNGETWAVNDVLYMNTTDGGLTKNRPSGTNTQIQRIAKVLTVNASSGQLFIFNTARTAGLPNLTTDYVWLGNGNDTPQEVIKTDLGVSVTGFSYDNNNTFTITDDNSGSYTATINQMSGLTINGELDVTGDVGIGISPSSGWGLLVYKDTTTSAGGGISSTISHDGTGTIGNLNSLDGNVQATSSGTITSARGVSSKGVIAAGTSTIVNAYNFYGFSHNESGGSITNSYGLYLEPQTVGNTNWGIYQAGTEKNYFGGQLQLNTIGSGTPVTNLGVDASGNVVSGDTGGDVFKVGTPANNQIGVWTGDGTLEGDSNLTWNGAALGIRDASNNETDIRAAFILNKSESDDANLYLYGYGTGHKGEIIMAAANGTIASPTATTNGNIIATIQAYGHTGTAHRLGGSISFSATENFVDATAYGTRFVLQTTINGDTSPTTRYNTTDTGDHQFIGSLGINTNSFASNEYLKIYGSGAQYMTIESTDNTSGIFLRANTGVTPNNWRLYATSNSFYIRDEDAAADRLNIDSIGNVKVYGELNVGTVGGTTSVTNLGIDASGNVVSGTTGGNVSNTGTPVNNQVAVWTNSTTIEGDSNFIWDGGLDMSSTTQFGVDLTHNPSGTDSTIAGYNVDLTGNVDSDNTYGVYSKVDTSLNGNAYGGFFQAKGSASNATGSYNKVGGGNVAGLSIGAYNLVSIDGSLTTGNNMYGSFNVVTVSTTGTHGSTMIGSGVDLNYNKVGGSLTSAFGFYSTGIVANDSGATIGTAYGLYLGDNTGAGTITNSYGVYQVGADDKNYFAGNVGIGTDSPDGTLHVETPTGVATIRVKSSGNTSSAFHAINKDGESITLGINGSRLKLNNTGSLTNNHLVIDSSGNVGINTDSPTEKLDVSGNVKISGTLNVGSIGGTTSVTNLGIDSSGNVVSGDTGGDVFKVGTPANNQIGVWTGDGTLEGDSNLTWNTTTLEVKNGNEYSRVHPDYFYQLSESDDANLYLYTKSNGTSVGSEIIFGRWNGTVGSESTLLNGQLISAQRISGSHDSGNTASISTGALIEVRAAEDWSTTAKGVRYTIDTAAIGESTTTERFAIESDGNVKVSGELIVGNVDSGTSVNNLAIDSTGKIIKASGNAIVDNFYYSISNTVDTRPIFEDDNVLFNWDETGNDLEFQMKVAPGGSGDMRSLGYDVSVGTHNQAITTTGINYDIYPNGVPAGNRMEAFIAAENDVTYPAYKVTVYNTGESFEVVVWIERITKT